MKKNVSALLSGVLACMAAMVLAAPLGYAENPAGDESEHAGHQHQHEHAGQAKESKKTPQQEEAWNLFKKGNALCDKGEFEASLAIYTKATNADPKFAEAFFMRGKAFYHLGSELNALEDFSKVIELNPKNADAYFQRGVVWYSVGNEEKMMEDLKTAAKLAAMDHTTHEHDLGQYQYQKR